MVRRSIAVGAGVIVLVLLLFGVRGCLDSRTESALRDYNSDLTALVRESNQQSEALFSLLSDPGDASQVDVTNQLNSLARQSEQIAERAADADVPDQLGDTNRYLVEALEFRRNGVRAIAERLPAAQTAESAQAAVNPNLAASMRAFLASDVIYANRVEPSLRGGLDAEGLLAESQIPQSRYLPDSDWVLPATIAERVDGLRGGGGDSDEAAAPGLHGNGLESVALGGQALTPDASVSVPLGEAVEFEVVVANQGENDETDVGIAITVGSGADAIEIDGSLYAIAAGEVQTVTIPLADEPPTGQNVPITVEVEPVPGEEDSENNALEFSAIFTA
jgi:hypothetical protein